MHARIFKTAARVREKSPGTGWILGQDPSRKGRGPRLGEMSLGMPGANYKERKRRGGEDDRPCGEGRAAGGSVVEVFCTA